jgi:putative hydrolase of the HAD superfamily
MSGGARRRVWLFDLDDTLHDASGWVFPALKGAMNAYIQTELGLDEDAAAALRYRYWRRYGATLTGLIRHHGVDMAHFLAETHRLPGLEAQLRAHAHDRAALARLPGRKLLLTNAPRAYAERVLEALGLARCFERVLCIEDMSFAGHARPKPDARMFRVVLARLRLRPTDCVLVEDQLQHQKAARALGLQTVWMQRWLRSKPHGRRPAYVGRRVHSLNALRRF